MDLAVLTSGLFKGTPAGRELLVATSIGWKVKRLLQSNHWTGRVHSVFSSAFNVRTPDGQVFGILSGQDRHCLAVNVRRQPLSARLSIGMPVTTRNGWMVIPDAGLEIYLESSHIWRGANSPLRPGTYERVARAAHAAACTGCLHGSLDGLGGLLPGLAGCSAPGRANPEPDRWAVRAKAALGDLLQALASRNPWAAARATKAIAGLGPGLTPAGDDLLAGLIGAWWWRERAFGRQSALMQRCLGAVASAASDCTNIFGYQAIRCASQGELPEAALGVVKAIITGSDTLLEGVVPSLLAFGATSGTDMLTGICLAFMPLNRSEQKYLAL
ncbi:MAG: DUF2877 domain-containing protein [Firmicutes bacterium]|nr:DUF2877 domain-containing protein [Bacillota bacterium]